MEMVQPIPKRALSHARGLLHAHSFDRCGGGDTLASLNTAFLPVSRSRFKQSQISKLISLTTVWRFCVNFWVIFGHFGKEIFSQKDRLN